MPIKYSQAEQKIITDHSLTWNWLLKVTLNNGQVVYYAERPTTYQGIKYGDGPYQIGPDGVGEISLSVGTIEQSAVAVAVQNVDRNGARLFDAETWRGATAELMRFVDDINRVDFIFRGIVVQPRLNENLLEFQLIQPIDPSIRQWPPQLITPRCRAKFARGYESLCPYGSISLRTGRRIGQNAATYSTAISATDTSITVTLRKAGIIKPGDQLIFVPLNGDISAGTEVIEVSTVSDDTSTTPTLTVNRGVEGTTATSHAPSNDPGAPEELLFFSCPKDRAACNARAMLNEENELRYIVSSFSQLAGITSVTVTKPGGGSPGWEKDEWIIDGRKMFYRVTDLSQAIDSVVTSFDVDDATHIEAGMQIRIDDEIMIVQSVTGNTLTVTRGATPASHAQGAAVVDYDREAAFAASRSPNLDPSGYTARVYKGPDIENISQMGGEFEINGNDDDTVTSKTPDVSTAGWAAGDILVIVVNYFAGFPHAESQNLFFVLPGTMGASSSDLPNPGGGETGGVTRIAG